jgi:hypothetical protein
VAYKIGGDDDTSGNRKFDPDVWSDMTAVPNGGSSGWQFHGAAEVDTGYITSAKYGGVSDSSVEEYDVSGDSYTTMNETSTTLEWGSAVAISSAGYFIGGSGGLPPHTQDQKYTSTGSGTWAMISTRAPGVEECPSVVVDGKAITIGGELRPDTYIRDVDEYNPVTAAWGSLQYYPASGSSDGGGVAGAPAANPGNDYVYVFDGITGALSTHHEDMCRYDRTNDTWTTYTTFPYPTYAFGEEVQNHGAGVTQ